MNVASSDEEEVNKLSAAIIQPHKDRDETKKSAKKVKEAETTEDAKWCQKTAICMQIEKLERRPGALTARTANQNLDFDQERS